MSLTDIEAPADQATARQPSPHFPVQLAVARVQAPQYKSFSLGSAEGRGAFSVVLAQELYSDTQLQRTAQWASMAGVSMLDPGLLPNRFESIDDLRLAAAKLQADVLLVFTVSTAFEAQGKRYEPQSELPLGKSDVDTAINSQADAVFVDVRTGFNYGSAEASARASIEDKTGSDKALDRQRLAVEQQAFTAMLSEAEKTWNGIAARFE